MYQPSICSKTWYSASFRTEQLHLGYSTYSSEIELGLHKRRGQRVLHPHRPKARSDIASPQILAASLTMQLPRIASFVFALALGASSVVALPSPNGGKRDVITSIEGILTTMEGDVTTALTEINNLVSTGEATVASVGTEISNIVTTVETATTDIASLAGDLKKRQVDIGTIVTELTTLITDLATTLASVPASTLSEVTGTVTSLDTALTGLLTSVNTEATGVLSSVASTITSTITSTLSGLGLGSVVGTLGL